MSIVNDPDNQRVYALHVSDPYLTKDAVGRYVILCDETVFSSASKGDGVDQCYTSEALVNPKPTEKDIFAFKLRGAVRESMFSVRHPPKDS